MKISVFQTGIADNYFLNNGLNLIGVTANLVLIDIVKDFR